MLYSSKLAAVLRKLHNANDMLQSSAYETSKQNSPNVDEMSVVQSADDFASNDDSQRHNVQQLLDENKECLKTGVDCEQTAQEFPAAKARSDWC